MNTLVVYKKSLYELYKSSSHEEVRAFLQPGSDDYRRLIDSHNRQTITLEEVCRCLDKERVNYDVVHRAALQPVQGRDLVISVGGDGTLLDVSHYIQDTPILGVNSDPVNSVGFYTSCTGENFHGVLKNRDKYPRTVLQRLQIQKDTAVEKDTAVLPELVLNDVLFAHGSPAAMTRYELKVDGKRLLTVEGGTILRSSGLLVCTAAGSTAWMYEMGGEIMPLESRAMEGSKVMQFHERDVRNALFSQAEQSLEVRSHTREGKLYLDGEHVKYDFTLGTSITITPGLALTVLGDLEKKRGRYEKGVVPRRME